jgi:hypothetical protein
MPCPPPDEPSAWPGLDEITASEAPRALTPVPGSVPKKRSGEYALELPPTLEPAPVDVPLPGIPPKLPPGAGRER